MAEIKAEFEQRMAAIDEEFGPRPTEAELQQRANNATRRQAEYDAMRAVEPLLIACRDGEITHEELAVQIEQYKDLLPDDVRRSAEKSFVSLRASEEVLDAMEAVINNASTVREAMELLDEKKHLMRENEYLNHCSYIKMMYEHPALQNE